MSTLRNTEQSIGRILGRTIAAAAIGVSAVTSFSAQAAEVTDTYSVAEAALTTSKVNEISEQQRSYESSSASDQAGSSPYDKGDEMTFGLDLDYEEEIYPSNGGNALGLFNLF